MSGFQPVISHVITSHVTGQEQVNHASVYDEQTPLAVVERSRTRHLYGCGFSFEERLHRKKGDKTGRAIRRWPQYLLVRILTLLSRHCYANTSIDYSVCRSPSGPGEEKSQRTKAHAQIAEASVMCDLAELQMASYQSPFAFSLPSRYSIAPFISSHYRFVLCTQAVHNKNYDLKLSGLGVVPGSKWNPRHNEPCRYQSGFSNHCTNNASSRIAKELSLNLSVAGVRSMPAIDALATMNPSNLRSDK
ncbi:hypothetical protein PoB_002650000 [Plakobranchus ocellatus]|uniref:Uncharacterized protein n=1 Tax=Plakobranchus ocellatus TaxID=259542 RepID=A0AAV3ZVV7_9GAST|nr:hypothetical protein PoB_002650000 [Plakobranchus ocellatus]